MLSPGPAITPSGVSRRLLELASRLLRYRACDAVFRRLCGALVSPSSGLVLRGRQAPRLIFPKLPDSCLTMKIHQVAQGHGHAQRQGADVVAELKNKLSMARSKLTPSEVLAEKHRKLAETASASQT
jgi:hypothetical protein